MSFKIPNTLPRIDEETTSPNLGSIFNSDPVSTVGSRRYDLILTSTFNGRSHLYILEYNGNEVSLARLRNILTLDSHTDETSAFFITQLNQPIEEIDIGNYAILASCEYPTSYSEGEETDQDTSHFHLLNGKIPENCCLLNNNECEDYIPRYELISHLTKFIQPWT